MHPLATEQNWIPALAGMTLDRVRECTSTEFLKR